MRRLLVTILTSSLLFLSVTFAGMSVFGMDAQMSSGAEQCVGAACHDEMAMSMGHDAPAPAATDCVDHCLASARALTTSTIPSVAMLAVILLFVAQLTLINERSVETVGGIQRRLSEGIGKRLRHLQLATVVLRN